jgi:hypothetical protein
MEGWVLLWETLATVDALGLQMLRVGVAQCGGGMVRRDVAEQFDWI